MEGHSQQMNAYSSKLEQENMSLQLRLTHLRGRKAGLEKDISALEYRIRQIEPYYSSELYEGGTDTPKYSRFLGKPSISEDTLFEEPAFSYASESSSPSIVGDNSSFLRYEICAPVAPTNSFFSSNHVPGVKVRKSRELRMTKDKLMHEHKEVCASGIHTLYERYCLRVQNSAVLRDTAGLLQNIKNIKQKSEFFQSCPPDQPGTLSSSATNLGYENHPETEPTLEYDQMVVDLLERYHALLAPSDETRINELRTELDKRIAHV